MTAPIVFCDTETTGLDPDNHEIWEVGLIAADGTEHHWFLPVNLGRADPYALKIGRFHERHPQGHYTDTQPGDSDYNVYDLGCFAREFSKLTAGQHLVGAVISFDERRLRRLLQANGACPDWHYHLVDVEALAAGWLAGATLNGYVMLSGPMVSPEPPWKSSDLTAALGITVDESEKHTALGDARWAKAIYDRVFNTTKETS